MSPRQQMRIGRRRLNRFEKAGHYKCPDLKIIRVCVGRRTRKMTEAAIEIIARQRPLCRALNRGPTVRSPPTQLMQSKHSIVRGMTIARRHVEQPAAIGLLVAKRSE